MDSTILSLLSAFLLSILGLFAFIWSLRKGLLIENPAGASVIFARVEIGRIDAPSLDAITEHAMQAAAQTDRALKSTERAEINDRIDADRSSAFPVFMFIAFACFWLLVGSAAGGMPPSSCMSLTGWCSLMAHLWASSSGYSVRSGF